MPEKWTFSHDAAGSTYFINTETNHTQWEKPSNKPEQLEPQSLEKCMLHSHNKLIKNLNLCYDSFHIQFAN